MSRDTSPGGDPARPTTLDSSTMSRRPRLITSTLEPYSPRKHYDWRLLAALWSLPALLLSLMYLRFGLTGPFGSTPGTFGIVQPTSPHWRLVAGIFAYWYLWIPLTPTVASLGQRFEVLRKGRVAWRSLGLHFCLGLAFGLAFEAGFVSM